MTCYCCGNCLNMKNGQGQPERNKTRTQVQKPPTLCLPLCFYTVTRPCPALGVCKQVCVCVCVHTLGNGKGLQVYGRLFPRQWRGIHLWNSIRFSLCAIPGHRSEHVRSEPGEELQANQVVLFQVQVLKPQSPNSSRPGGLQRGSETGLGSRISLEHSNTT